MADQKKHGSTRRSTETSSTRASKVRQVAPSSATPTMNDRLRKSGRWIFLGLAIVFGFSFVFAGIGTGGGLSLADLIGQSNDSSQTSTTPASDSAVQAAEAVTKKSPQDPQAWLALAEAQVAADQLDQVPAAAQKASELAPTDAAVQASIADVYLSLAGAALQEAQALYSSAQSQGNVNGRTAFPSQVIPGQGSGATVFQTAQESASSAVMNDISAKVSPLQTLANEAYQSAVVAQTLVTDEQAQDPAAWFRLAQIQTAANDTQGAIASYGKFVKLAPDDPLVSKVQDEIKRLKKSLVPESAPVTTG